MTLARDANLCPLQVELQELGQDLLITEIRRPPIRREDRLVQFAMGQVEPGRAGAGGTGGVATTSEIASALGMHVGNVSRALARLVAAGRVRRMPREGHRVPYELVL